MPLAVAIFAGVCPRPLNAATVDLIRTPNHGIQPQAVVDSSGGMHLIYFKGEPGTGDVFYVKRVAGESDFSTPMRVNSHQKSAIATGTIRGAHLAIGKNNRPHVSWMGSSVVAEKKPEDRYPRHPMLYSRLNDAGTAFEPERDLLTWTAGLDGGGSIAADSLGNVYVAWHGSAPDNQEHEFGRAVFVAHSKDDGKTFERERKANPESTGACGCCGMRAFTDSRDILYMLYRTANQENRDMALLRSDDQGQTFTLRTVSQWKIQTCPMSSSSFGEGSQGIILGTEKSGMPNLSIFKPDTMELSGLSNTFFKREGKHPSVAANSNGEMLVAWAEGAGWAKGGSLRWQVFDEKGSPTTGNTESDKVPIWSLPAVVSTSDDTFLIVY